MAGTLEGESAVSVAASGYTFGERLRLAIEQQPAEGKRRGLRLFKKRIAEHAPDVPGTSLRAIQGYLRGDAEPTPAFIAAAAQLLGVRAAWLAWDHGAPTEEAESARRDTPAQELQRITAAVDAAFGLKLDPRLPPPSWAPTVRQAALRLYQHREIWELFAAGATIHPSSGAGADASWTAAIEDVARAIAAPLETLGIPHVPAGAVGVSPGQLHDYIEDAARALARMIQRVADRYAPVDQGDEDA